MDMHPQIAEQKIKELVNAYEVMRQSFLTIQRLMPEVEAQLLSTMGGVGAAPEREMTREQLQFKAKVKNAFYKTHKVKNNFKK